MIIQDLRYLIRSSSLAGLVPYVSNSSSFNFKNTPVNQINPGELFFNQEDKKLWIAYQDASNNLGTILLYPQPITGGSGTDVFVTGGTAIDNYTDFQFTNNTGGTFVVSGSAPYNAGTITNATGWTDNGNGTMSLPQINVALYDNANFIAPLRIYTIPSGTTGSGGIPALQNNDTNYVVVEYNGGSPRYYVYDNPNVINYSSTILFMVLYRANNFIHLLEFGNYGAGLPNRIDNRINNIDRFGWESGFSLGLSGSTGVVTLSSGVVWNGVYRQSLVGINSQDNIFFQNFHSGGTWVYVTTADTLNNIYYDDGTDRVLATAGKYLVNWYFRGQEINSHLYEVWGNDEYDNVADAQLSVEPSLPELVSSHAFLVGRIIVQVSATTGSVESAFVRVFQSTQVTNHNDLLGLQGGIGGEYFHLSSTQYNNNAYTNVNNNFSVGQNISGGLTATTISATTYQNLPIDVYVTGGTYSSGTATFTNNTGGTFNVVGFSTGGGTFTGGTVSGATTFTGGLTANTISATTYQGFATALYPSGTVQGFWQTHSYNGGSSSGAVINQLRGYCITIEEDVIIDRLYIRATTTNAAARITFAIYNLTAAGYPNTKLFNSAEFTAAVNTLQTQTVSWSLSAGTYFVASNVNSASGVYLGAARQNLYNTAIGTKDLTNTTLFLADGYTTTSVYSTTLPATFPAGATQTLNNAPQALWFRVQ